MIALRNEQSLSEIATQSLLMPFSSLGRECLNLLTGRSVALLEQLVVWLADAVEAEHQSRFIFLACMQTRDSS